MIKLQPDQLLLNRLPSVFVYRLVLFFVFIVASFLLALSYLYFTRPLPLYTPLGTIAHILGISTPPPKTNQIVFGFLPYWQFKDRDSIRYNLLTHLGIFAVDFNAQGQVNTRELDYQEPGWTALNSTTFSHIRRQARAAGTKLILVIKAFDADTIDSIIASPTATQNIITATLDIVSSKNFDGVNIDFEYVPEATSISQTNFTRFVDQFSTAIKANNPALEVSIDVFGDSYKGQRIWQIDQLVSLVDHIIIMAYDYHRPSSPTAGPVAPLYGGGQYWDQDITASLAGFTKLAPAQKFVLGVPYYGYEWSTFSSEHLSPTYKKSGSTATYKRIQELLTQKESHTYWDQYALSPWLTYKDRGSIQQVYYENVKSLGLKYDLVRQSGLSGIAIWALGYDAGYPELWDLIAKKFY